MTTLTTCKAAIAIAIVVAAGARADVKGDRVDRVERVVVFADRAEVTRATVATCAGGVAEGVFAPLPDSIDPRTLRGDVARPSDANVVGVAMKRDEQREAIDVRVRTLQQEIQAAGDAIVQLQRAQADDDERQRSLNSYGAYFRTAISEELRADKPAIERFEQLLTTLSTENASASSARVARNAKLRVLQRRQERHLQRLNRLQAVMGQVPATLSATVSVRCGAQNKPTVRLSYVVPQASWNPEYDLRFTGPAGSSSDGKVGKGQAALTVAGVIRQSTGEDWDGAEVWLSTAKPRLGGEAPLPYPIVVSGGPEEKQKTLVQAQEVRAENLKAGAKGNAGPQSAELDDGGKAFVLKLPNRVTVVADGRPYWFPVDEASAPATSALVALPALSPWVYQVARFKNPASFPLVEGTVHVFRGGSYVGDERMAYRAPGEPIELSMGVDETVALERIDLMKGRRDAGFFSGSQSIVQAQRSIIRNRSNDSVTVELREQIPVSKTTDITVTIDTEKTTEGSTLDALRGHLTWKVTLKRGQSAQRDLAFTIALPKEWAVQ
jgi:uncharacterized protein (TIGR02231 family)